MPIALVSLDDRITIAHRRIDDALDNGDRREFAMWTQRLDELVRERAEALAVAVRQR